MATPSSCNPRKFLLNFPDRTLNEEYYTVENMADENQNSIADSPRDCLLFRMSVDSETADLSLVAESCFVKKPYLCEIRVQTVTYYSWFVANWVEMLLGFLLLIMFVSLIVTLCACTSRDSGRSSAARYDLSNVVCCAKEKKKHESLEFGSPEPLGLTLHGALALIEAVTETDRENLERFKSLQ